MQSRKPQTHRFRYAIMIWESVSEIHQKQATIQCRLLILFNISFRAMERILSNGNAPTPVKFTILCRTNVLVHGIFLTMEQYFGQLLPSHVTRDTRNGFLNPDRISRRGKLAILRYETLKREHVSELSSRTLIIQWSCWSIAKICFLPLGARMGAHHGSCLDSNHSESLTKQSDHNVAFEACASDLLQVRP